MKTPKFGEVLIYGPDNTMARLKKCQEGWVLRKDGVTDHCRFGNAEQIRQDIDHFEICGNLPRGTRQW